MSPFLIGLGVGFLAGICTCWALEKSDGQSRRSPSVRTPQPTVIDGASRSVHPTALGGRTVEAPLRNVKLIRDTSRDRRIRDLLGSTTCWDCGRPKPPQRLSCDSCGVAARAACLRIIEGDAL